jgi:hypothetical protein
MRIAMFSSESLHSISSGGIGVQQLERLQTSSPAPAGCTLFYGNSSIRLWTRQKPPGIMSPMIK